ncbi:MAG: CdaR family transcriptional regulator [Lachnospiraceae bacterium]|nr:CdaR family transcriptional regulator [Lachnospiraceae bacterium]
MLYVEIAKKFIERLTLYTKYNINIMDERGIIIASRNPDRISTFHEIAFDIIKNQKPMIEVSDENRFLGVLPGVNLLLTPNGKPVGVIGVTGNPSEVKPIAMIVKMSLETMLEYEMEKDKLYKRQSLKESFAHGLLYDTETDPAELSSMARFLNYNDSTLRIPVLCCPEQEVDGTIILRKIKSGSLHTSQDMSFLTRKQQILVFKTLPDKKDLLRDYKFIIGEYLSEFLQDALGQDVKYHFYVGTIQNSLSQYKKAYEHCLWLERNVKSSSTGIYFYDYIDAYMKDITPLTELHHIFRCLAENILSEKFLAGYTELMQALKKNNYNMVTASKDLYIHKNTLAFRLDKIRQEFNMNPLNDTKSREFMEYFYYYLKRK